MHSEEVSGLQLSVPVWPPGSTVRRSPNNDESFLIEQTSAPSIPPCRVFNVPTEANCDRFIVLANLSIETEKAIQLGVIRPANAVKLHSTRWQSMPVEKLY